MQRRFLRKRGAAGKRILSVIAARCQLPREGELAPQVTERVRAPYQKLPLHREMQGEFKFTVCYLFLYIS